MNAILAQVTFLLFSSFSEGLILDPDMVALAVGLNDTQILKSAAGIRSNFNESGNEADYPFGEDYYGENDDDIEIDEDILREFADLDVDDFDMLFKGRWSYAPGFIEKLCRKKCQEGGKPFGRLLGAKCSCYCPLNAAELDLCSTTGYCDKFCASLKFYKGGDCVFNNVCFCYCKDTDEYNPWVVYTLEGSSTPGPDTTTAATTTPTTTTTAAPTTHEASVNSTKVLTNGGRPGRPRPKPRPQRLRDVLNYRY